MLYSIFTSYYNKELNQTYFISNYSKLNSFNFLKRSTIEQSFKFIVRESSCKLKPDKRFLIEENNFYCYTINISKININFFLFTNDKYPKNIAFKCINELVDNFEYDKEKIYNAKKDMNLYNYKNIFKKYENSINIDKIAKVQKNVDEVKDLLKSNLLEILDGEENLNYLVQESKDLQKQAKIFHKNSKKTKKKCCIIF